MIASDFAWIPFTTSVYSLGSTKSQFAIIQNSAYSKHVWSSFLQHFYAFLIWSGSSKRVWVLCFDMLCRIFFYSQIFFPLSFLLGFVDLMRSSRSWAEFTQGSSSSQCRQRCRPAPGRKDPADSRDRDGGAALILCGISMWWLHVVHRT